MSVRDTLLLDQAYQPIKVIGWQRALCMQFLGKVEMVCAHDWQARTVSDAFPVPAVVRLFRYVRKGPLPVRFSRENVYLRDGYVCQYCGVLFPTRELTLDHVIPRWRGGRTNWKNVVTACVDCNRRKGGHSPEQAGLRLLSRPARPHTQPVWYMWDKKAAKVYVINGKGEQDVPGLPQQDTVEISARSKEKAGNTSSCISFVTASAFWAM